MSYKPYLTIAIKKNTTFNLKKKNSLTAVQVMLYNQMGKIKTPIQY
jgi:hypothetical protein